MQKRFYAFCLALLMVSFIPRTHAQRGKSEIAMGYGYMSFYSFVNHAQNSASYNTSSGSFNLAYRYYVSRQVTLGVGLGIENISTWGSFFTIAPEVTVAYLDTRDAFMRVRLYGSVSAGVSILSDNVINRGESNESGLKPWAFQATPFGMRLGRQFAGFIELGYGYKGLVHGGIELRFPRVLHHRHKVLKEVKQSQSVN
jgi:hypothetical protein